MDWLGGLSNIKGQITNLTKDLLAEGTTDLIDPKSELELARTHISELQNLIDAQKTEIFSLKTKNDELQVQLESAELRLDHAREQFQMQIKEKEAIIAKLRSETTSERGEPEGQPAATAKSFSQADRHADQLELASEEHGSMEGHGHDGQATWQELRNEVAELRAEVAKWRRIAKQKKAKDRECASLQDTSAHDLEKEIELLKQKLSDTEELRQAELTALRDTHTEHMNNLFDQLRETETEVLSLRTQLEETTAQLELSRATGVSHPQTNIQNEPPVEDSPSPVPERVISKKKQRPMKKRKPKAPSEALVENTETSQVTSGPPVEKEYLDMAVQCQLPDSSTDNSIDFEKIDPLHTGVHTPSSDIAVAEVQTQVTTQAVAVQSETETLNSQMQTDPEPLSVLMLDTTSVSCQTSPASEPLNESSLSESCLANLSAGTVAGDDGRSQISDTSDVSVSSRHLDDLVHQLAEEIRSYENVMDEVMNTVSQRLPGRTGQSTGHDELDSEEIAQRLAAFQVSLKQRRDRLGAIRKRNRKQLIKTDESQSLNRETSGMSTVSEVVCSRSSSPVIPSIETSMCAEPTDVIDADADGWHDEEFFGDLQFETREPLSSIAPDGDDKKTQIVRRSESTETLVSGLRNTIHELEARLSVDSLENKNRVAELEEALKPADRLQSALKLAVQQLVAELPGPPPLPPRSPSLSKEASPPPPWPPVDPEAQLAMILGLERVASDQVKRLRNALDRAQEALDSLAAENKELQRQLMEFRLSKPAESAGADDGINPDGEHNQQQQQSEPVCVPQTASENEDISDVAYRLCLSLDPDYSEQSWDPDQWDYLLYELLKTRFDESPAVVGPTETADERVVQLSAEVAALRGILGQHAAFRSQAERDLRQLLGTVNSQRAQLDELTAKNEQLTDELDQVRRQKDVQPVNSRRDETDELSRTAIHQLSELVRTKEEEVERLQRRCDDLKELIRSAHVRLGNQSDDSADAGDEDVTVVLERLTREWSEAKTRADRAEAMYESVLSALEQKHAESQAYHTELQRVCADLASSNELCQSFQKEASELREKLIDSQSKIVSTKTIAGEFETAESEGHARGDVHEEIVTPEASMKQASSVQSAPDTNEAKLLAELQRLQAHLLEMEESYTTEALNAEAREVDLRSQLHQAHERLGQLEQSSQTVEQRICQAQTERDEARRTNEACQREIAALQSNLANLQSVLDSFQQNQQSAVTTETEHIRMELQRARQNESSLRTELDRLTSQLADRNQLEERARQLSAQIQRHNSQVDRIRAQVDERDAQIDSLRNRLAQMAVDTDSKIDKVLIKNLLLSYFQLPSSQKQNGLRVIGSLLQFTDEEYNKAGSSSGAIPTLFNWVRNAVSSIPAGPPKDVTFASSYPDKSFTELLLAFLEQEAGLRAPMKLSMDYYTPETVRPNTGPRRPSQPDSELDDSYQRSWSNSALMTPTAPSQSSANPTPQPPLNPLFQM